MDILTINNSAIMPKTNPGSTAPVQILDITNEVCPMTFVRTRLALERLAPGQTLLVLLRGGEPRLNVPRTAAAQGHQGTIAGRRPRRGYPSAAAAGLIGLRSRSASLPSR